MVAGNHKKVDDFEANLQSAQVIAVSYGDALAARTVCLAWNARSLASDAWQMLGRR